MGIESLLLKSSSVGSEFLLGLLYTSLFFVCAFFITVILKAAFIYLRNLLFSYLKDKLKTQKEKKEKPKRKPIKTIEINPEEVDRIYMKKSS